MKNSKLLYCLLLSFCFFFPFSRTDAAPAAGSWSLYIYLCGSNLESQYGAATEDLNEIASLDLPDGLTVVVQTGGSETWQNELVNPEFLERYVFQGDEGWCEEQLPLASMADADTFADFLRFCHGNYPAEHEAVILWDHGGGTVSGVAADELYNYDTLTLAELYEGFRDAFTLSEDDPPLELVGFDACLMATIDTAHVLSDVARYMVASEESEPGCGWNYEGLLQGLSDDLSMDGARLGTIICDTYQEGCRAVDDDDYITLSVTDLQQIAPLLSAYNDLGSEALLYACQDSSFFSSFGRGAERAENYGGNTPSSGYSNMVDLGDLVTQNRDLLPETAQTVLDALENCIVYRINGPYRKQAAGLSCYYSYNGDRENYQDYSAVCASESFDTYYNYMLNGDLSEEYTSYITDQLNYEGELAGYEELTEQADTEELPLYLDEDGYAVLQVEPLLLEQVRNVSFMLSYFDEEDDILLYLGTDNDLEEDWESGTFRDNFRGVWGALDGHLVYMEVIYVSDDYTFYNVPILLNGEEYQLKVIYDYDDEEFHILGACQGLDSSGMADRNMIPLQPGDVVTTRVYASSVSGDEELELYDIDEFTVTEDTSFGEEELGDGHFLLQFSLTGARNETVYSQSVLITCEEGEYSAELS